MWGIYLVDAYITLYVNGCLHHLPTLPFDFPFIPSAMAYHVIYLVGLFIAYTSCKGGFLAHTLFYLPILLTLHTSP